MVPYVLQCKVVISTVEGYIPSGETAVMWKCSLGVQVQEQRGKTLNQEKGTEMDKKAIES
mgnify:CR=1 FL=1